jgi:hypothetical protein
MQCCASTPVERCVACVASARLQELRHFVVAPAGATWAEMVIRAGSYDTPKVYMIRCALFAISTFSIWATSLHCFLACANRNASLQHSTRQHLYVQPCGLGICTCYTILYAAHTHISSSTRLHELQHSLCYWPWLCFPQSDAAAARRALL